MEFIESLRTVCGVVPPHSILLAAFLVGLKLFWVWAILDCAFGKSVAGGSRLRWLLVVCFLKELGALIYYFKKVRAAKPAAAEAI